MKHLKHLNEYYEGGRGAPTTTYCGTPLEGLSDAETGWDSEFSELIRNTAILLDATDRSKPLDQRAVPKDQSDKGSDICEDCFTAAVRWRCYPEGPPRHSKEELKQFVLDVCDNRVYLLQQEEDHRSFTVLSLMSPMPHDYLENVGAVYEHMDKAGPLAINGRPMFLSCKFMHIDDWNIALPAIQRELERRDSIEL